MNETEIRNRIRDAVGETDYPPTLTGKVLARVGEPPSPAHPRLIGAIAAVLAVLIVVSFVYVRAQSTRPTRPANPSPPPTAAPVVTGPSPQFLLPEADLAAGRLTAAANAVTPLHLVSTSSGRTVTLIAGYADPSRIVLVFRTLPDAGSPQVQLSDEKGPINAGYFGASGAAGDQVVGFQQGPHVGGGGTTHLTITITGFAQLGSPSVSPGSWTFSADLPVRGATPLPLTPKLTAVGTWKVTVEAFELTPSVIHLRAVFDGAGPFTITDSTVVLVGPDGLPVKPTTLDAVPTGANQTRLDQTWIRPASAASYQLQVNVGVYRYSANVSIPAPASLDTGKPGKGQPLTPLSFPQADESLDFQGAISDHITTGRPQSCGFGSGPDGKMIYEFATYFESHGVWYYVSFTTDKAVQEYHGPSTYTARTLLSPIAVGGAAESMFAGTAQLTVVSDGRNQIGGGGLQSGKVSGSLGWTDDPNQKVNISGTWTCRFSSEMGPA